MSAEFVSKNCLTNLYGLEGECAVISGANCTQAGITDSAAYGILVNVDSNYADSSVGQQAALCVLGRCWALAGATVLENAWVKPDASGRLIPAVAGDTVIAKALTAASGAGVGMNVLIAAVPAAYEMP